MTPIELANLRCKRCYIHKRLDYLEPWVARLRADLAETEAAIQAVAPQLNLPPRRYAPNPYFARGELPRLALAIMREAREPIGVREIAIRALATKGIRYPDRRAMKLTRLRLIRRSSVSRARDRADVGTGKAGKQELAQG